MKKLFIPIIFLTLLFFTNQIKAQTDVPERRHKAIFLSVYEFVLPATVNYDMRFKKGVQDGWGFRVGMGFRLVSLHGYVGPTMFALPVGVNYLAGEKRSAFEAGFGLMPYSGSGLFTYAEPTIFNEMEGGMNVFFNFGYRLQPINNGFVFRFNWNPHINSRGIFPIGLGISAGYGFK